MTTEVASAALFGIETGLQISETAEKIQAQKEQEEARLNALNSRLLEEKLQGTQKTVERDEQIQKFVGHQMAVESASGFELSSPSFRAITMDDFNKFAQARSNDALELNIKENQIQDDMIQTKIATSAQIQGDVLSTAGSIISNSGLFTNIASSVIPKTAKLATPQDKDEFDDATRKAKEKRQSGNGLFDEVDNNG